MVTGASSGIGHELAKELARQGFDLVVVAENEAITAVLAGKDHVVTGSLRNKVQAVAGRVLPDRILTAVQRRVSAPGTAHR